MAAKWKISYTTEEAAKEVAFLFEDEDRKREIKRVLARLVVQDDPRTPKPAADLKVGEMVEDALGWFSVAVPRYAIRIIFRLWIVQTGHTRKIERYAAVDEDADEYWIEIMRAGFIGEIYDPTELRRRYRKYEE